jgi:hypothetical protein
MWAALLQTIVTSYSTVLLKNIKQIPLDKTEGEDKFLPDPEEIDSYSRDYNVSIFVLIGPVSTIDKILSDVSRSYTDGRLSRNLFTDEFSWYSVTLVSFVLPSL